MTIMEMKSNIKRYEEALELIMKQSDDPFIRDIAKAALGKDNNFEVIPRNFERRV